MKKVFMGLGILASLVLIALPTLAVAQCPTPSEYKAKVQSFQDKAYSMMATSLDEAEKSLQEQDAYIQSTFPACVQYFKETATPDCSKLQTLSSSFVILDKSKKATAKSQLKSLPASVQKCGPQYDAFKFIIE